MSAKVASAVAGATMRKTSVDAKLMELAKENVPVVPAAAKVTVPIEVVFL
jgi:hypothetical protein